MDRPSCSYCWLVASGAKKQYGRIKYRVLFIHGHGSTFRGGIVDTIFNAQFVLKKPNLGAAVDCGESVCTIGKCVV
jgi:hypothetical protein